ncbi:Formin-like protein 5 [Camellia lanceoleosa]|uniref:Formin-like protein 5 n=1 Tax=Camellia lanceoleosa TaxID=1840588 RepID=A0ACC0GY51_9ERIC|nr:Formin-like protein 5 [Camellia lanceoleosa]
MMETLFGYASAEKNKNERRQKDPSSFENARQFIQIIDPKKSQNLAILLKALNVTTEEVCDALKEGNELPAELVQTLLKMAPTTEEELKLRLYSDDLSHLGPAERFLKIACTELKNSRLFLKLLEAVLKTGNRMNDGTFRGGAQAFKLDTLLKLSDVKGTDGKTTLLHFVVKEIIRSEGVRAARAARQTRARAFPAYKPRIFLRILIKNLQNTIAILVFNKFCEECEVEITWLLEEEKRIMGMVKTRKIISMGMQERMRSLRLFVIVRDFLIMLDKECVEVRKSAVLPNRTPKKETPSVPPSLEINQSNLAMFQRLFPAIRDCQVDDSSSDDESLSP